LSICSVGSLVISVQYLLFHVVQIKQDDDDDDGDDDDNDDDRMVSYFHQLSIAISR